MRVWNEGKKRVITAVGRVDLRVAGAAPLVQNPSLQGKCAAVAMETEAGSRDSAAPKSSNGVAVRTHIKLKFPFKG